MFNPFKKKSKDFNFDDSTLKSMNDSLPPSTPDISNTPNLSSNTLGSSSNRGFDEVTNDSDVQSFGTGDSFGNSASSSSYTQTPVVSQNPFPQNQMQPQNANQELHQDLIKTKIESLEYKTTIMDSKLTNIENKIDFIYQLLLEEIGEDTKKRLNIKNMMDAMKKNK